MASIMRTRQLVGSLRPLLNRATNRQNSVHLLATTTPNPSPHIQSLSKAYIAHIRCSSFHTTRSCRNSRLDRPSRSDFGSLDVLGNTPIPSTSVDVCMSSGFTLNNGARTVDGSGILIVGGEAFRWRPWQARPSQPFRLLNNKGQWDIDPSTLDLLGHLWPRPDLLVLGLGPENRPISPQLRRAISALGMRVEVLDTRNAAAQFNLLARERGVNEVAAAMVPIGWQENIGAGEGDGADISHE